MAGQSLSHEIGEITSDKYSSDTVAICHIVNASGCKNFGLSLKLAEKYPYADIYGSREPLYNLNRARVSSRDEVGRVRIFKEDKKPYIICLVAHYAPGNPTDEDENKIQSLKTSSDKHYVHYLKEDTLPCRITNLLKCIEDLAKKLPFVPVKHIYVPAGVGCGLKCEIWQKSYLKCF